MTTQCREMAPDVPVVIGREGDLALGIAPFDPKVSRRALTVTSLGTAWRIEVGNHNGAELRPWGQPAVNCRATETLSWPRVTVRIIGDRSLRHVVLLEHPALVITAERPRVPGQVTESVAAPPALTQPQREALRLLFGPLLTWPQPDNAVPLRLGQVARRLGITTEAVRRRLEEARHKANVLGLSRQVPLTDPEYLHVLVRAGLLPPADEDIVPELRRERFHTQNNRG
jgi:hypothetical protein